MFLLNGFLTVITIYLLAPFMHQRLKAYQHGNSYFGQTRFSFHARVGQFADTDAVDVDSQPHSHDGERHAKRSTGRIEHCRSRHRADAHSQQHAARTAADDLLKTFDWDTR